MTFDTIVSYIDDHYDPLDFADYNSFIEQITSDWQQTSSNPDLIFRSDIQEGLFDIYADQFGLREPESFEELIEEFSEPQFVPLEPGELEEFEPLPDEPKRLIDEAKELLKEIKSLFKKAFGR